jgi:hypothetical protein
VNYPAISKNTRFYPMAGPYSGNQAFVDIILSQASPNYSGVFSTINMADAVPTSKAIYYERVPTQLFCFRDHGTSGAGSAHFPDTYRRGIESNLTLFDTCSTNMTCGVCTA